MSPITEKWGKITFTSENLKTDFMLYKELSYLLIPSESQENRFVINSGENYVHFYLGSTSYRNFAMMESFFTRIYDCVVEPVEQPSFQFARKILVTNSPRNKRRGDFYYPEFIRNVVYLPFSLRNMNMSYQIAIRSSVSKLRKEKRFSMFMFVGFDGDEGSINEAIHYFRKEMRSIKSEKRWGLKIIKERDKIRVRTNVLYRSFNLANFIRIPEDQE